MGDALSRRLKLIGLGLLGAIDVAVLLVLTGPQFSGETAIEVPSTVVEASQVPPSALFVGDSFPAGSGAATTSEAMSCLTASTLGWTCHLDAQPGTGFIANGQASDPHHRTLIERLPTDGAKRHVDIVIVDAGRNDRNFPEEPLKTAISDYLRAVRDTWPDAAVVVIEPYFINEAAPLFSRSVLDHLATETRRVGGYVISPHEEQWIDLTSEDRNLDAAGHRVVAGQLVQVLRKLGLDEND